MYGYGLVFEVGGIRCFVIVDVFGLCVVVLVDLVLCYVFDFVFVELDLVYLCLIKVVVVLYDGWLIVECYVLGYGLEMLIWGYLVIKLVIQVLIGILVCQSLLQLDGFVLFVVWVVFGNLYYVIIVDQLLWMDSGLFFDEIVGLVNLVIYMWFCESDLVVYVVCMLLVYFFGIVWGYSNFSFVLLLKLVGDVSGDGVIGVEIFVWCELFELLGMYYLVIEIDVVGILFGLGFMYVFVCDFVCFGQFYLDDGVVVGWCILFIGWVVYSVLQILDIGYGVGFWINFCNEGSVLVWDVLWGMLQQLKDMFYVCGVFGQYIIIVLFECLVVVWLGLFVQGGSIGIGDVIVVIIVVLY